MEALEPYLEQLLVCKTFPELSQAEREYVLAFLSEADYYRYREFLVKSILTLKTADHALVPYPEIATNLKRAFKDRHKKTATWPASFARYHFRFPLLPTGLGLCAIIFLVYQFHLGFMRNPPVAAEKSRESTLNIPGVLSKPIVEQDLVLPPPSEQLGYHLNSGKKKSAKRPLAKAQSDLVMNKAAILNTLIEGENFSLATNMAAEADSLDEKTFDTSYLTIPGIDADLLIPETRYN